MSTTLFDPMLLRDMKFVVYWKDSCLAGYHEVNFIAPSLKIRVVHMVKKDDPRCADMVCSIALSRLAPKLTCAEIIGPSYCERDTEDVVHPCGKLYSLTVESDS